MMNDRVADMITRIRNGQQANLPEVKCPASNLLKGVCSVLEREGYIRGFDVAELDGNKRELTIQLKYHAGQPVIKKIKRISKCGRRIYSSVDKLPKYYNGLGIAILSTPKGVISDYEARQQYVGGEILCSVF